MSEATTQGVQVTVQAVYVPERSDPDHSYYFFAYQVRIANVGDDVVQLLSRHWIITDANGHVEHVRGPGVVGETPVLHPGQSFTYTSACPLRTPVGAMHGTYQMVFPVDDEREGFDAEIAPFTLAMPDTLN
ncbi:MAG: Co2+/Mg2+ efflux protein ApaG [Deltaproteobacteria bacterium]|nr:MAG: Co2+/Mg2+ efflux protein ApaG [Deltaproteobacteria bacterium]